MAPNITDNASGSHFWPKIKEYRLQWRRNQWWIFNKKRQCRHSKCQMFLQPSSPQLICEMSI